MGREQATLANRSDDHLAPPRAEIFAEWIAALQPDLRRLGMRLAANAIDAADLAQATCLRALEKRRLFARGSLDDLRRWLRRIMVNLHRDLLRQRTREVLLEQMDGMPAAENGPPPFWTQIGDEEVRRAIGRLSLALRDVYLLRAVERFSYDKIAARLRIPMSTVATRMFRARLRLRALLGPAHPAPITPIGAGRRSRANRQTAGARAGRRFGAPGAATRMISLRALGRSP
jgi:RNA polymerase sigma-70 factor (ECF subfamily)